MIKNNIIEKLENLVLTRFENLNEIKKELNKIFKDFKISIDLKTRYDDETHMDFNIIGNLKNSSIFCDFDLYYLFDNNKNMLITEAGYEFE